MDYPSNLGTLDPSHDLFGTNSWKICSNTFLNFGHRLLPSFSYLPDGDNRKDFREDHIEKDEERDAPGQDRPLHPSGKVKDRLIRKPRIRQGRHNDHKSLQPHANDHRERSDEGTFGGSGLSEAENGQGNDETEKEHSPEVGGKPSCKFRPEDGHMERLVTIVNGDILCKGEIKPEERHDQQKDSEIVKMNWP